jgi:hypothetical protein
VTSTVVSEGGSARKGCAAGAGAGGAAAGEARSGPRQRRRAAGVAALGKERKLGLGVERVDAGVAVVLVGSREERRRAAMPVAAEVFGEMREPGARAWTGRRPIGRGASSA